MRWAAAHLLCSLAFLSSLPLCPRQVRDEAKALEERAKELARLADAEARDAKNKRVTVSRCP